MNTLKAVGAVLLALSTWGCQSMKPITTVESLDLKRFMGDWYAIAHIPTFIETEAYNAVESYRLAADGTIETVFRFNQGGSDGPAKVYTPRGLVQERQSNAVWGMQFIWPIKAEYRIIYLAPDYSQTVIGRTRRDYVWIMARQPSIPAEDYARIPIDELRARMDELPRKRATSGLTASWVSAPTARPGRCCSTGSGSGASAAATRRKGK
ncbi:MAG: lipocalin family protein [Desulfobacterales bacterium]|jgi:apolipoprotein D and lipocalin family protein|nr:lipocalin family protein [Desulfobacterales bacterium]